MTKNEIITIAKNVELMDKLNVISGLLEMNENEDKIDELVSELIQRVNNDKPVASYAKKSMLKEIEKVNPELAAKLQNARSSQVRFEWWQLIGKVENKK